MKIENKIEQQLKQDYDKFYEETYKGKVPTGIISFFKKGIMVLPAFSHRINFLKVKSIASKEEKNLTVGDLHELIKVVLNTAPEKLYKDFEEAVAYQIQIDKFAIEYNQFVDDFKQKMSEKKANLLQLSGVRNSLKMIQA